MRTLNKILTGIVLSLSTFTTFANELGNPGFEDNTTGYSYGNNLSADISPWTAYAGPPNVVQTDGPGGQTWYDIGQSKGPQSDASSAAPGVKTHYLDMQDNEGSVYQAFTTPEECSGEVRFGGFFSTRQNSGGEAHLEIREGTGATGTLIGTTTVISLPAGNTATDPWVPVNFVATLSAGTTYSLVIWMDNNLNFDEAYVNFVDGPCKDDSDLADPEPEQCLILEPKVECVANKWQVSINNNSSSFNADVLDITSLTSGVTISGSSPNWILDGALPNSSVDITVDGTVIGGGKAEFADLCCTTKLHLDIPDEECEIVQEKPHIYTRKSYVETEAGKGEFRFVLDSWVQLNDPMTLTITDTIPAGVTLTSLDSTNTSNWSCPGLPVAGPGTLVCTYIGVMPISAGTNFNVLIYADIEPSAEDRENCIKTNLIDTDSNEIPYDGNDGSCVDIPPEDNSECQLPYISIEGHCELPCENDSQCSGISGSACLPFYNTETLVCQTAPSITQAIEIDKFAPKTCRAGGKCKFIFTISNKTKKSYSGFVGITDKPKKRFGRIRGKSKGWSCKKKGREYRCGINKLRLKPDESKTLSLILQVPKGLSGKVENCASLQADSPVSPQSCVTVNIINDQKCGYDDKLVNGRCVARCTRRNSHWNGVDCMVCRNGKIWNDRYKRCDKKPKEVIKSCPSHYLWSPARKKCIYVAPKINQDISTACNKGTHYDLRKKRCVENITSQKCNRGTHYNAVKGRCVENQRPHPKGCPSGQIYLSDLKRCVKLIEKNKPRRGGPSSCGIDELWNIIYKKCEKLPEYETDGNGNDGGGHP